MLLPILLTGEMVNMFVTGKLIYIAIVVFCAGDLLSALLFKKAFRENAALRFSLAYGLGVGTVTMLLLYLSCAGAAADLRQCRTFYHAGYSRMLVLLLYEVSRCICPHTRRGK